MGFKEFYLKRARSYPLSVAKTAYGYTLRQHDARPALSTAATLYAAKLENRRLRYAGYTAAAVKNQITVYRLQTETISALKRLSAKDCQEHRYSVSAMLGENCHFMPVAEFKPGKGEVLGVYVHRNRYVAVVRLKCLKQTSDTVINKDLRKAANILAKNAVAWYPEFVQKNIRSANKEMLSAESTEKVLTGKSLTDFSALRIRIISDNNGYGQTTFNTLISELNMLLKSVITLTEIHLYGF